MRISRLLRAFTIVGLTAASPLFAQTLPERTPIAGAWGPNGTVSDSVVVGNTLLLGGDFDYIGPPTGSFATTDLGTGGSVILSDLPAENLNATSDGAGGWFVVSRRSVAPYHVALSHVRADGSRDPAFVTPSFVTRFGGAPLSIGILLAGGRLYAHGDFHSVSNAVRPGLVALDPATGAVLPWDPGISATYNFGTLSVGHVAVDGNVLYVTGYFESIAGQARNGMAALDADTGALRPAVFSDTAGGNVSSLSAVSGRVYASGGCNPTPTTYAAVCVYAGDGTPLAHWGGMAPEYGGPLIATPTRVYIGATLQGPGFGNFDARVRGFHPVTGAPDGWQSPRVEVSGTYGYPAIAALEQAGGQILFSGTFSHVGGVARTRYAAVDAGTGALTAWQPAVNTSATHLVSDGARVALVGTFASVGGRYARYIAALDLGTGRPAPVALPSMPAPVNALAASGTLVVAGAGEQVVALSATSGAERTRFSISAPGQPPGTVLALAIAEPLLFVGGNFVDVLGQPRRHLAAIDMRTGLPTAFNPQPDNQVYRLRVSSGAVYAVGYFATVPGYGRGGAAAWDIATGALETFSPPAAYHTDLAFFRDRVMLVGGLSPNLDRGTAWAGRVAGELLPLGRPVPFVARSAARVDDTIIVGGDPSPGWRRAGVAAIDAATGAALPWAPVIDREAYAFVSHVQATPSAVVVTGTFSEVDGAPAHNLAIFPMARAAAPRQMTAAVSGNTLTLGWQPGSGPAASGYVVEVGTSSGGAEVGAFPVGALTRVTGTLPAGTFFARVRGASAQGTGAPGSEVIVTTPSVSLPPQAPSALSGTVANGVVMLTWSAAAGNATTYVVEAGTGPGLSNIGALPLGHLDTTFSTPAPPGTYVVRVRAANAFGVGPASNEITVTVP